MVSVVKPLSSSLRPSTIVFMTISVRTIVELTCIGPLTCRVNVGCYSWTSTLTSIGSSMTVNILMAPRNRRLIWLLLGEKKVTDRPIMTGSANMVSIEPTVARSTPSVILLWNRRSQRPVAALLGEVVSSTTLIVRTGGSLNNRMSLK